MTSDTSPREEPCISVICRTLGRAQLTQALESVAAQRYRNIELLVVDAKGNGLPDWAAALAAANASVISQQQPLPRAEAANVGLEAASGDYLLFLDEDDWIAEDHIEKLLARLSANPDLIGAYSDTRKMQLDGEPTDEVFARDFDRTLFLRDNYIPIHALLFSRLVVDKGCRFDVQFEIFEDWDFWLQAIQYGDLARVEGISAFYREGGQSQTGGSKASDRYNLHTVSGAGRVRLFEKWLPAFSGEHFNAMLGALDSTIEDLSDSARQHAKRAHEQALLAQQQAALADEQRRHVSALSQQLSTAQNEADRAHAELRVALEKNDAANKQAIALSISLSALQRQVDWAQQALTRDLDRLEQPADEQAQLAREIANLRKHIRLLEVNLNAIYASTGWRLMGPARRLMRIARRLLGFSEAGKRGDTLAGAGPTSDQLSNKPGLPPSQQTDTPGSTALAPLSEPLQLHGTVDVAVTFDGNLYLRGWATANQPIERIVFVPSEGAEFSIERSQQRRDIAKAFPANEDAEYSGFTAFVRSTAKAAEIRFYVAGDLARAIAINPVEASSVSELFSAGEFVSLDLQTQYEIYRREEQRRDSNHQSLIPSFKQSPLISIIVPVFNVEPHWLDACVESVLAQSYPNWQLCLHDDKSTKDETLQCLRKWEQHDDRIMVSYGQVNQHISGASNAALAIAQGQYIGLMDNDDELHPLALEFVVAAINKRPEGDYFYTDEDKLDEQGNHCQPHFKPDWSPTLLQSMMYVSHFAVIRRACIDEVGGFRMGYEGSQDFDLTLRIAEITDRFVHIPKILYHWRIIPGSASGTTDAKSYAYEAGVKALTDHVRKDFPDAQVSMTEFPGFYQVRRPVQSGKQPRVTVVMPFHNKAEMTIRCLRSILISSYDNLDVLVISNNSDKQSLDAVQAEVDQYSRARLLVHDVPFNWSAINNFGASQSDSEYLLFMNNDMEAINADWLERMLDIGCKSDIGVTGAKLLYEDTTVQHAGIVIGLGGVAGHAFKHMEADSPGYFGYPVVAREVSAVTGACMLVRRTAFDSVAGFDEGLAVSYNDVDICLRLKQAGYATAITPFAQLYHFESKTRPATPEDMSPSEREQFEQESAKIRERYPAYYENGDPYYNPNLTLLAEDYSLRID
jgi:glycosyltransferase involved in cell wall biosynthesis